ncbi:hypothetical protein [Natrinema versiforme]|uniref:Uncharacterized protein n=1 Tax=Natrinema versiforme JCM 10478 TaxID=1227496 RepID=L9Y4B6_9EURY|nr:hypothetical protein [Natrinema versiforme]ELY68929.1 hypothetical protein C489_06168 [Natrinema versiforme JCM 10478]
MTLTTAVSRQYRSLTDRALSVAWSRLATVYLAVYLATALSSVYIELLAHGGDSSDTFTVDLGLESALDAAVQGLAVGAVVAPVLFAVFAVLTRVLPVRRVYAQTVVPWILACPVGLVAFLGLVMFNGDAQIARALFDGYPWVVAEWAFMWAAHTTLLVAFIGGAYALSTRSISLSRSQKRALVVAIVVLVAVPIGVGAAFPMDSASTTDESAVDSSHGDGLDDTAGSTDDETDENDSDDESSLERLLDGRGATDPETYDDGKYSPRIRNATALDGDSPNVTVSGVSESELPPANATDDDRPIAAVHTDGDAVSASNIEFEIQNGSVVPKARYHLSIDGVDTTTSAGLDYPSSYSYGQTGPEDAYSLIAAGEYADIESGYYVDMEEIESMYVYMDVTTEDGEIHRYVVELERTGVPSDA